MEYPRQTFLTRHNKPHTPILSRSLTSFNSDSASSSSRSDSGSENDSKELVDFIAHELLKRTEDSVKRYTALMDARLGKKQLINGEPQTPLVSYHHQILKSFEEALDSAYKHDIEVADQNTSNELRILLSEAKTQLESTINAQFNEIYIKKEEIQTENVAKKVSVLMHEGEMLYDENAKQFLIHGKSRREVETAHAEWAGKALELFNKLLEENKLHNMEIWRNELVQRLNERLEDFLDEFSRTLITTPRPSTSHNSGQYSKAEKLIWAQKHFGQPISSQATHRKKSTVVTSLSNQPVNSSLSFKAQGKTVVPDQQLKTNPGNLTAEPRKILQPLKSWQPTEEKNSNKIILHVSSLGEPTPLLHDVDLNPTTTTMTSSSKPGRLQIFPPEAPRNPPYVPSLNLTLPPEEPRKVAAEVVKPSQNIESIIKPQIPKTTQSPRLHTLPPPTVTQSAGLQKILPPPAVKPFTSLTLRPTLSGSVILPPVEPWQPKPIKFKTSQEPLESPLLSSEKQEKELTRQLERVQVKLNPIEPWQPRPPKATTVTGSYKQGNKNESHTTLKNAPSQPAPPAAIQSEPIQSPTPQTLELALLEQKPQPQPKTKRLPSNVQSTMTLPIQETPWKTTLLSQERVPLAAPRRPAANSPTSNNEYVKSVENNVTQPETTLKLLPEERKHITAAHLPLQSFSSLPINQPQQPEMSRVSQIIHTVPGRKAKEPFRSLPQPQKYDEQEQSLEIMQLSQDFEQEGPTPQTMINLVEYNATLEQAISVVPVIHPPIFPPSPSTSENVFTIAPSNQSPKIILHHPTKVYIAEEPQQQQQRQQHPPLPLSAPRKTAGTAASKLKLDKPSVSQTESQHSSLSSPTVDPQPGHPAPAVPLTNTEEDITADTVIYKSVFPSLIANKLKSKSKKQNIPRVETKERQNALSSIYIDPDNPINVGILVSEKLFKIGVYSSESGQSLTRSDTSEAFLEILSVTPEICFYNHTVLIGQDAFPHRKNSDINYKYYNIFQLITSTTSSATNKHAALIKIEVDNVSYHLCTHEIIAIFLHTVLNSVEDIFEYSITEIGKVIFTIPFIPTSLAKERIKESARIAGIHDIRILSTLLTTAISTLDKNTYFKDKDELYFESEGDPYSSSSSRNIFVLDVHSSSFSMGIVSINSSPTSKLISICVKNPYGSDNCTQFQDSNFIHWHKSLFEGQNITPPSKEHIRQMYERAIKYISRDLRDLTLECIVTNDYKYPLIEEMVLNILNKKFTILSSPVVGSPLLGASLLATSISTSPTNHYADGSVLPSSIQVYDTSRSDLGITTQMKIEKKKRFSHMHTEFSEERCVLRQMYSIPIPFDSSRPVRFYIQLDELYGESVFQVCSYQLIFEFGRKHFERKLLDYISGKEFKLEIEILVDTDGIYTMKSSCLSKFPMEFQMLRMDDRCSCGTKSTSEFDESEDTLSDYRKVMKLYKNIYENSKRSHRD